MISCLMVTADRPHLVPRALECYRRQTWPNKELIVVDNGRTPILPLLQAHLADDVRYLYVEPAPGRHLGYFRNCSLEMARGEFVCQFDDDDWYHPERLREQIEPVLAGQGEGTILKRALWLVEDRDLGAYPFRVSRGRRGHCATLLARRCGKRYPNIPKGEDTAFVQAQEGRILHLDRSHLYIRVFHGSNTWDRAHFLEPVPKLDLWFARYILRDLRKLSRFRLTAEEQSSFDRYLRQKAEC